MTEAVKALKEFAAEIVKLKTAEVDAAGKRAILEQEMIRLYFPPTLEEKNSESKLDGAFKVEVSQNIELVILDAAKLREDAGGDFNTLVRTKYEFAKSGYNALEKGATAEAVATGDRTKLENLQSIFAKHLNKKVNRPSVKVTKVE